MVIITDDGHDFSLNGDAGKEHFGLENMQRRIKECGGTLNIHSAPDEGAAVEIIL